MKDKLSDDIEIRTVTPDDVLGTTELLYKTWLDTYPNEEHGITVDDIEDSYKDAFSEESIKATQQKY